MRNSPLTQVKGIGPKKAELFNKLGIFTVQDLLNYFPKDYFNLSLHTAIKDIAYRTDSDTITVVKGKIFTGISEKRISKTKYIYTFGVTDEDCLDGLSPAPENVIQIKLFNQKYLAASMKEGDKITIAGKISGFGFYKEMVSPHIFKGTDSYFRPIYRLTKDVTQNMIYTALKSVIESDSYEMDELLPENLPETIRIKYDLIGRSEAYKKIHEPLNEQDLRQARKRLAFEEIFLFRLGLSLLKTKTVCGKAYAIKSSSADNYESLFSFDLTSAQKKAINDALTDMGKSTPMSRMVQGDVGSGKTAVAAALCYITIKNGYQACVMAPTEILAVQHYNEMSALFEPYGIKTDLLTGSVTASKKKKILESLKSGETNLIIGTHALTEDNVKYKNLGLAVTDEQHRFGVEQRMRLSKTNEDGFAPHIIVMSATPIPRSLALVLYGDLSLSVINEMPKGRKKVSTFLLTRDFDDRMFGYIAREASVGRQAYIVCPMIEENEDSELTSVLAFYDEIKSKYFENINTAFVHGKMKGPEKDEILNAFSKNETSVLVSTTVIEVGVNVPNATTMVILNAEKYGLSQLHQLRGRVGRGNEKSYCFLISDTQNEETKARLQTLCDSNDGFEIAKKDLEQRGPGDFFGNRQHGLPEFKVANLLTDMDIVNTASESADEFSESNPNWNKSPENEALIFEISRFFARAGDGITI